MTRDDDLVQVAFSDSHIHVCVQSLKLIRNLCKLAYQIIFRLLRECRFIICNKTFIKGGHSKIANFQVYFIDTCK